MARKEYRFNPFTGAIEPVQTKEQVVKRLLEKGADFDEKLLLWYGERQHLLAR